MRDSSVSVSLTRARLRRERSVERCPHYQKPLKTKLTDYQIVGALALPCPEARTHLPEICCKPRVGAGLWVIVD